MLNFNTISSEDVERNKNYLCRILREVKMPSYTQAAELANSQCAGLMTIETYYNILEQRCFMTRWGLKNILSGNPF